MAECTATGSTKSSLREKLASLTTKDAVDATILMDDRAITENALSVTFKHTAGKVPTVKIKYFADECTIRTLGELIVKKALW